MGEIVSSYSNSEGERISIQRVESGPFEGQLLLCIHDDDDSSDWRAKMGKPAVAPHLLDEGTREWLLGQLSGFVRYEHTEHGVETSFHEPVR